MTKRKSPTGMELLALHGEPDDIIAITAENTHFHSLTSALSLQSTSALSASDSGSRKIVIGQ